MYHSCAFRHIHFQENVVKYIIISASFSFPSKQYEHTHLTVLNLSDAQSIKKVLVSLYIYVYTGVLCGLKSKYIRANFKDAELKRK